MSCEGIYTPADNAAFVRGFSRKAAARRIPLNGSLALTHRCNLRCSICYVRDGDKTDIETALALRLIGETAGEGCLSLVLTGGEPLLHPDFAGIYTAARARGMLVTVFTNGTLIDADIVSLFKTIQPRGVDITIYGATAGTYEAITGVPGSYAACRRGLDLLAAAGIPFRLKTMLSRANQHELNAMEELARQYGTRFRFDAAIFPTLRGDPAPLAQRVSPADAAAIDFADAARAAEWRDQWRRVEEEANQPLENLYACGAGVTAFHIDPNGGLHPCVLARAIRADAAAAGFGTAWRQVSEAIMNRKSGRTFPCRACPRKILCGYCPGFFELENGAEEIPSSFLCEIGRQRWEIMNREKSA